MLVEKELEILKKQWDRKTYFTDAELCELFQVGPQVTWRWRKQKMIGYLRTPTGTIRYLRKHVEEFERRFEQKPS
jgi:predicted site-specific integrase-resolvase